MRNIWQYEHYLATYTKAFKIKGINNSKNGCTGLNFYVLNNQNCYFRKSVIISICIMLLMLQLVCSKYSSFFRDCTFRKLTLMPVVHDFFILCNILFERSVQLWKGLRTCRKIDYAMYNNLRHTPCEYISSFTIINISLPYSCMFEHSTSLILKYKANFY